MKKKVAYILLFSFILFNASCKSRSGNRKANLQNEITETGKIVGILDGDTYDILMHGNETVRVRMEGIDAPEKGMPFYKAAKNYLATLCFGKQVRLKISRQDNHDRTLALSYLEDGTELSHEMLKAGLAWHFKKYNSDVDLAQLEMAARNLKIGLWIDDNPMPPWENRALHRSGVSTKDSFHIKEGQQ
ncbi:MAG: thermonuclease family protein [Segetibacter sp.]|nr:thermonuclease family protein [Segetibacter sp.]